MINTHINQDRVDKKLEIKQFGHKATLTGKGLSLEEIDYVFKHFDEDKKSIQIDNILKDIKFLSKFDKSVREIILMNSELKYLESGSYLFSQGDQADHMYIILRGTIAVKGYFKPCGGEIDLNTMKDGDHFGDISFLQ